MRGFEELPWYARKHPNGIVLAYYAYDANEDDCLVVVSENDMLSTTFDSDKRIASGLRRANFNRLAVDAEPRLQRIGTPKKVSVEPKKLGKRFGYATLVLMADSLIGLFLDDFLVELFDCELLAACVFSGRNFASTGFYLP